MEYVVYVKVLDIFTGNNIDFLVPLRIQLTHHIELLTLAIGEMRKIFLYYVVHLINEVFYK